jgi:aminopeptidase N
MLDETLDLTKVLSPSERVALLNDSWALVRIGETDIAAHLALVERFRKDRDRAVVSAILGQLETIGTELVDRAHRAAYTQWVGGFLSPIAADLGWESAPGRTDETRRLRAEVIWTLGYVARDPETLRRAREQTELALEDPNAVDPTLLDIVVDLAALEGDAALFEAMKTARARATSPHAYYLYSNALPKFENAKLRDEAFALALSPEMRNQDLPGYIGVMFDDPDRQQEAWKFLQKHFGELRRNFTPWGGAGIVRSTGKLCDPGQREEVKRFFAANPVPASGRSLREALERIDMCVELRTLQTKNLESWLDTRASAAHGS